jgi:hypothetical protein
MSKKGLFLLLALIVPLLVFCFLKFFGKNEFVVEPLFQTGESKTPAGCQIQIPYIISDSIYSALKQGHEDDSLLIVLYERYSKDLTTSETQLDRVKEAFQLGTGLGLHHISNPDESIRCGLVLKPSLDLVLVDAKKRIRGQYNSNDRDEVDRLMTELDIILKRY